ncbi:pimeloyl-ACP methyl ester carboxylesterase [Devosia subaequoris]|uniref:Pimeloyl-ACP methyl ester carboxylesterase n=1 Tax=Devosia subaequoris TaxID=395930 RepID=A0A7W6ILL2_9HYPH|nr:hypothetical protein [Devosia subaequoris]MBB4051829.1 pimeloyl-ACP methyl ester carboxylesterase [Devosia subaequoris]MCP1210987.1 hypothetical protein [Devosia subaequoris]
MLNRFNALAALTLLALPQAHAIDYRQVSRADGTTVHYTLDTPAGDTSGLLVLSQGSGCARAATSPNLATVRAAFPDYAALIVEKIGITPDVEIADPFSDCPAQFYDNYTVSQRVSDYRTVLDALAADPAVNNANTILFGGSEGGLAMAMLAELVPVNATILLSTATGETFGDMVLSTVPPEARQQVQSGFEMARNNPQSSERLGGSTYRFWADGLDLRPLDHMQRATAPILLIQGGLDGSAPVAASRTTLAAFAEQGLCNLTYWEFPALDHGLTDPTGTSHLPAIARLAAAWTQAPIPAC